ncbi:MAG: 30S ribosomal protein S30e [Thermoproteota archaeon]
MRSLTPKTPRKEKSRVIPRIRNKRIFRNRITLRREPGQQWLASLAPRPRM